MMATQQPTTHAGALWGGLKGAGKKASIAGQKAKLGGEMLLLDQKIKNRKQNFGIGLYDHLANIADGDAMFIIDNPALENIRGLFVTTYKDNKALHQKVKGHQLKLAQVAEERRCVQSRHGGKLSFDVPADTVGERIMNAPKLARIAGQETKVKTAKAVVEREMTANKQNFGLALYAHLVELELCDHWVPEDKDVRFHYEECRRDIARFEIIKDEKGEDIDVLGNEN
ncbi:expressed unknown protein [Seminavis robusta]|uniref:Uncharacterized protein n=1 Tax=Seminavis robusta TaxID=568900 RepID=A0A9N8HGE5_9STRA|nr:expressed unknown protein [Seminavis robusta]|eukprot:Sro628_g178060.1 n/a (227) ;mRNA; f:28875-29555